MKKMVTAIAACCLIVLYAIGCCSKNESLQEVENKQIDENSMVSQEQKFIEQEDAVQQESETLESDDAKFCQMITADEEY